MSPFTVLVITTELTIAFSTCSYMRKVVSTMKLTHVPLSTLSQRQFQQHIPSRALLSWLLQCSTQPNPAIMQCVKAGMTAGTNSKLVCKFHKTAHSYCVMCKHHTSFFTLLHFFTLCQKSQRWETLD